MEQFIRSLIDLVNAQIGPLEKEYREYVDLRQRLMDLLKQCAEARQDQLTSREETRPTPTQPGALTERILALLKRAGPLSGDAIMHGLVTSGWESTSKKPRNVIMTALSTLRRKGRIAQSGAHGQYRYKAK